MQSEKVTIAIPTLNRAEYLKLAIASALAQTYTNIEVIISDNVSTDNTSEVLSDISDKRLKILSQASRLSMVDNWNACLASATGYYFLLLSDDDLLESNAIAEMVGAFDKAVDAERVGMVYCRGQFIDQAGRSIARGQAAPVAEPAESLIRAFFRSERDTWPCSILFRRSDMGCGYSSAFSLGMDAAMWMQAVVGRGEARFVNQDLVCYRVHENATAKTPIEVWQRENRAMAAFAIKALQRSGVTDAKLIGEIEQAVDGLNIRIIPALIRSASGGSRMRALREYGRYLPSFLNPAGLVVLFKGLLLLLLPARVSTGIKYLRALLFRRDN